MPTDEFSYANVSMDLTVEDQIRLDQRKAFIARIPARLWFVSHEPAIGPLRIAKEDPRPDWLIVGGESGAGARPMQPQWVEDVLADCRRWNIAAFFKQWGSHAKNPLTNGSGMSLADSKAIDPHGKGGGLVGGRLIRAFPDRSRRRVGEHLMRQPPISRHIVNHRIRSAPPDPRRAATAHSSSTERKPDDPQAIG